MRENIYAGIVTYNPDIYRLKQNIDAIYGQVNKIIIIDNFSSNRDSIKKLIYQGEYSDISFYLNDRNRGIAYALNRMMNIASEDNIKWIVTLDQDSVSPLKMIYELYNYANDDVGIVCPQFVDINDPQIYNKSNQVTSIKKCITSGSLTNINVWKKVGGFDENMFIDGVDFDYCYRIINEGYKILQINNVHLMHEIGHAKIYNVMGKKIKVFNHSAFRKYYIAFNIVYFDRKYKNNAYPIITSLRVLKQAILVILFECDKYKKIKKIIEGYHDGLKFKF